MEQSTAISCAHCNEPFPRPTGRGRPPKYCGKRCVNAVERQRQKLTGYRKRPEVKARRAVTSKDYDREYRQASKIEAVCEVCGETWRPDSKAKTRGVRFCSRICGTIGRYGPRLTPIPDTHPSRSTPVPGTHPSRYVPRPPRFRAGRCCNCGDWYICDRFAFSNHTERSCSKRCAKALAKVRRRAAERDAFVEVVDRHAIFERDEWSCKLCGEPLDMDAIAPDPRSPTIDHVIPLARGGTHEPANVQAAHFWCNSVKSDTVPPLVA